MLDTNIWETPRWLIDAIESHLDEEFDLDVCGTESNKKAPRVITKEENALTLPWHSNLAWCNPPYRQQGAPLLTWVNKAIEEYLNDNARTVVMLLPASTSSEWFHRSLKLGSVGFIKRRVAFNHPDIVASSPKHDSIIVVFSRLYDKPIGQDLANSISRNIIETYFVG